MIRITRGWILRKLSFLWRRLWIRNNSIFHEIPKKRCFFFWFLRRWRWGCLHLVLTIRLCRLLVILVILWDWILIGSKLIFGIIRLWRQLRGWILLILLKGINKLLLLVRLLLRRGESLILWIRICKLLLLMNRLGLLVIIVYLLIRNFILFS